MEKLDRRGFMRGLIGTFAVATVAAGAGVTLVNSVAEAAPVPADKNLPNALDDFIENVQHRHRHYHHHHRRRRYHHHHWHRRRRRRWHCWWSRGRRVCGWRYW